MKLRLHHYVVALALMMPVVCASAAEEHATVSVRGKPLALSLYRPTGTGSAVKGTIIIGSGDVGWVGLAASMAEFEAADGYIVVGINVRQYLAAFTSGHDHLTPADVPRDYAEIAQYLRTRDLLRPPVVVSGVSEGAALAVLAASLPSNHQWLSGVITMGLPASAEVAWRWSDFTSWLTKKDAAEPSFETRDYVASVSPLPLFMIQSTKDEYIPEADYRALEAAARAPKRQTLIDASNHRFTDRIPELRQAFTAALLWMGAEKQS